MAFLLVIGLGYGAYLFFNPDARTETVAVPNVFDLRQDAAEQAIKEAKLVVVVQSVTGPDDASLNRVTNQNPVGGVKVAVGSTVTIEVNAGPKKATIPSDLVGKSLSDAKKSLADLGFTKVTGVVDESSTAKANSVLSVQPTAGANVALDTPITLTYAPEPALCPTSTGRPARPRRPRPIARAQRQVHRGRDHRTRTGTGVSAEPGGRRADQAQCDDHADPREGAADSEPLAVADTDRHRNGHARPSETP